MNHRLVWVCQGLLGSLLWSSALLKGAFPRALMDDLVFRRPWFPAVFARELTMLTIGLELFLGAWLISGWRLRAACYSAAFLVLAFLFFHAMDLMLGTVSYCSCYGALILFSPKVMFVGNFVFLLGLMSLPRLVLTADGVNSKRIWPIFLWIFLGLGLIFWASRDSRFDPYLLRLQAGLKLQQLPSLFPASNNQSKRRIVIILESSEQIAAALPACQPFVGYQPVFLIAKPPKDLRLLLRTPQTSMPIQAELASFFYRTTPTSFTIENEKVSRVWYGSLPTLSP